MYPAIPLIIKTIIGVGVVLGGVTIMSKKNSLFPLLGNKKSQKKQPPGHPAKGYPTNLHEAERNNDLRERLAKAEERAVQLENQMKELRSENHKLKIDLEEMMQRIGEARKLEVSSPKLLQWLQKLIGKKMCEKTIADITELTALLSANGLTIDQDYEPGHEGFICVKDRFVTAPEVSLPVIVREDDIILEGIVKVPMSFAGAEPPVEQVSSATNNEDGPSGKDEHEPAATEAEISASDNDDDFIVTTRKGLQK